MKKIVSVEPFVVEIDDDELEGLDPNEVIQEFAEEASYMIPEKMKIEDCE